MSGDAARDQQSGVVDVELYKHLPIQIMIGPFLVWLSRQISMILANGAGVEFGVVVNM